ncbi:hypothetical protein [Nocardioides immobilis]|uniref:hypothetical protein n=1 Tax=Nocardioides immobilis TaxID=2049295 RepID=UPI0011C448E9|nr:hypothetical protein [Nocardioides immobilis]
MRRSSLLLGTAAFALLVAPAAHPPAVASCAAPYLVDVDSLVLARGATATIEGRAFADGCRDSMSCGPGLGCDDCEYDDPPEKPMEDVALQLVQRGRTWDLGVADAESAADDRLGWVTWTFEVPKGVKPGPARLVADGAGPTRIRIG